MRLIWDASTDDVGVTGYERYVNDNRTVISDPTVDNRTNVRIARLTPGRTYTFGVKARDAAGNVSTASEITFTMPADTGGSQSGGENGPCPPAWDPTKRYEAGDTVSLEGRKFTAIRSAGPLPWVGWRDDGACG